jgi:hypothetical protein
LTIDSVVIYTALDKDGAAKVTVIRTLKAVRDWRNLALLYGTEENMQKAEVMVSDVESLLETCGVKMTKSKGSQHTRRKDIPVTC